MIISIDTDKLDRKGISVNEYLTLLSIKFQQSGKSIDYIDRKVDYLSLSSKGYISIDGATVSLLPRAISLIDGKGRDYIELASKIRQIFPTGNKDGKYPWRGTLKSIVDKIKKLDKSYGLSKYSDEDILSACSSYVSKFGFKDMDRGMQIAPYFIEKEGISSLMSWLENKEEIKIESKSWEIKL